MAVVCYVIISQLLVVSATPSNAHAPPCCCSADVSRLKPLLKLTINVSVTQRLRGTGSKADRLTGSAVGRSIFQSVGVAVESSSMTSDPELLPVAVCEV